MSYKTGITEWILLPPLPKRLDKPGGDCHPQRSLATKRGIEKGREEGREESRETIARKALAKGVSLDIVREITGLSTEEIQNL